MLNDQLDETALAGAEMSVDTTARQTMKDRDWLLREKFFELVGGHVFFVKRSALEKQDLRERRDGSNMLLRQVPPFVHASPFPHS
jgi:hypothetical protein